MKHFTKKILLFTGCLIFSISVLAQEKEITGRVTDENNLPLPGVNVVVKGTTNGTQTDFDGEYSLTSEEGGTLVFSFIGMEETEILIQESNEYDVVMQESSSDLEEVVVIGYGTQQKGDVTGAVSSANLEAFEESPNTNIAQTLQGTVPGLNVGQVNSAGGTPSISIRGQASINGSQDVLIILDGIQYNGSLSSINPNDVESIDILKDASSTAVYGAQAANGVILITTKRGNRSQGPSITIASSYTTQNPSENLRPAGREEFLENMYRQSYDQLFLAPEYTTPNPDFPGFFAENNGLNIIPIYESPDNPGEFRNEDYDWYEEGTQNGFIQENQVNVSGGSDRASYLLSLGLTEQQGFIKNDNFSRKDIRVNVNIDATDWWEVGVQTFGSFVNQDGAEPSLYDLFIMPPILTPYDENGELIRTPTGTVRLNPFLSSNIDNYERHDYLFANIFSEIDVPFLKGLSYRINFGNNYRIDKNYQASVYAAGGTGEAYKNIGFYRDYTLDNILKYNRKFGKHNIEATALYGAIERKGEGTNANASNFDRLSLGYNDLGTGGIPQISSNAYTESLNYQMFRLNYKFDNRYILTGTIRRDGFSAFAENEKTAYFPSGALGWIISNESFLEQSNYINNLKLRVSYGISGNQTGRYSSLARLLTRPAYVFGDGASPAFGQELTSLANPNLRWERTKGLNVGLDFGLFSSRLTGSVDVYKNTTDDLLYSVRVPYLTGFNSIQTNVGSIENRGVEVSLTGDIVRTEDFTWRATANFSRNRNEIITLNGEDADGDGVEDDLIQSGLFIGKPINTIYNYDTNGIYQIGEENILEGYMPGQYRVVDQNGDGEIQQADDRVFIGSDDPNFRASLLNTFTYKNLSLNVFLNSIQGGNGYYIGQNDNAIYRDANSLRNNIVSGIDYWSPTNPDGLNALAPNSPGIAGTRYEDRSFVRLQDISLRYSFNQNLIEKLSISDLSIFVSGKNLMTWTEWKGWDPETGQGLIAGGRPVLKGYSLGFNLSF